MTQSLTKAPHGSPSFHSSSLERSEWIMWKKTPVFFFIGGISGISLLNVPPCSVLCFCWASARQGSNNMWWVVTGRQRDHCLEMKRREEGGGMILYADASFEAIWFDCVWVLQVYLRFKAETNVKCRFKSYEQGLEDHCTVPLCLS